MPMNGHVEKILMRSCSVLMPLAMAACSSSPDGVATLNCDTSLVGYCPGGRDCTFDEAKHDTGLCNIGFHPSVTRCGDYTVIFGSRTDDDTAYYYRDGELTAKVYHLVSGSKDLCSATSDRFEVPECDHTLIEALAVCQ